MGSALQTTPRESIHRDPPCWDQPFLLLLGHKKWNLYGHSTESQAGLGWEGPQSSSHGQGHLPLSQIPVQPGLGHFCSRKSRKCDLTPRGAPGRFFLKLGCRGRSEQGFWQGGPTHLQAQHSLLISHFFPLSVSTSGREMAEKRRTSRFFGCRPGEDLPGGCGCCGGASQGLFYPSSCLGVVWEAGMDSSA